HGEYRFQGILASELDQIQSLTGRALTEIVEVGIEAHMLVMQRFMFGTQDVEFRFQVVFPVFCRAGRCVRAFGLIGVQIGMFGRGRFLVLHFFVLHDLLFLATAAERILHCTDRMWAGAAFPAAAGMSTSMPRKVKPTGWQAGREDRKTELLGSVGKDQSLGLVTRTGHASVPPS